MNKDVRILIFAFKCLWDLLLVSFILVDLAPILLVGIFVKSILDSIWQVVWQLINLLQLVYVTFASNFTYEKG